MINLLTGTLKKIQ